MYFLFRTYSFFFDYSFLCFKDVIKINNLWTHNNNASVWIRIIWLYIKWFTKPTNTSFTCETLSQCNCLMEVHLNQLFWGLLQTNQLLWFFFFFALHSSNAANSVVKETLSTDLLVLFYFMYFSEHVLLGCLFYSHSCCYLLTLLASWVAKRHILIFWFVPFSLCFAWKYVHIIFMPNV